MLIFELGADLLEFFGSEIQCAAVLPSFIKRHEMNVGMRNVGANDLPKSASAELFFHMLAELFDGDHEGLVIFIRKIVDFVDFVFRDDQDMTFRFWVDIEKSESFIVFVDFVAGNFTLDDFGKNTRRVWLSLKLNNKWLRKLLRKLGHRQHQKPSAY